MSGPDFIVIGAMKCATSALHEQLARQPDVFMSTPKEPNFFSDDAVFAKGEGWYRGLFEAAPETAKRGESSTHYTKLPAHPRTVERMKAMLPDVRLIYIMRHPIERLVSHYVHEWTQRVYSEPIGRAVDARPELIAYSRYAMQLAPYFEAYGREAVLPVFHERLTAQPEPEFKRICRFMGSAGEAGWDDSLGRVNASSERLRRSAVLSAIMNAPGSRRIRRLFPQATRDRVKALWQMKDRPRLTPDQERRLRGVFDADLAKLSVFFGVELTCENWRETVLAKPLDWTPGRLEAAA